MESELGNIGEILREGLENHRVEPDSRVWDNIEQELGARQLSRFNKDTFERLAVQPSARLWQIISRKLWLYHFYRFTPNQFNIYYLTASLVIATGITAIILSGTQNPASFVTENPAGHPSLTEGNNAPLSVRTENGMSGESSTDESVHIFSDAGTPTEFSGQNQTQPSGQSIAPASENSTAAVKVAGTTSSSETELDAGNSTLPASPDDDAGIASEYGTTDAGYRVNDSESGKGNTGQKAPDIIENEAFTAGEDVPLSTGTGNSGSPEVKNEIQTEPGITDIRLAGRKACLIEINERVNLPDLPDGNTETITLEYPDTVGVNAQGEPIVIESDHWYLDFYVSPVYTNSRIFAVSPEYTDYAAQREDKESPAFTWIGSAGANAALSHKNIIFQTGINYSGFGETYTNYVNTLERKDFYDYFSSGHYNYDTIMFTQVDSMLEGSSYQVPYVCSTWVETTDSALVTDIDTIRSGPVDFRNTYRYLEIPVAIGYELKHNRFTYSLKAGLITGIFLNASGKTLSLQDDLYSTDLSAELPFNKFAFSTTAALGVTYDAGHRIGIFGEVYYRHRLNSLFAGNYHVGQKHHLTGFRAGVRISLTKQVQAGFSAEGLE
ncbi:MAG: hypothetical protein KJ607_03640 [Bacteroidetes bacterium]|nr:hypothetical protein [Bacteroidota bacterium]